MCGSGCLHNEKVKASAACTASLYPLHAELLPVYLLHRYMAANTIPDPVCKPKPIPIHHPVAKSILTITLVLICFINQKPFAQRALLLTE